MSFRSDIRKLYRENPTISGKEILRRLGRKGTPNDWKILSETQVQMRGNRPAQRKNRSKGPLNAWRGPYVQGKIRSVSFIPPDTR